MEKLKDLLHDFTDVIMAIGIVIVMFAVVTMSLGDWFEGNTISFADSNSLVNSVASTEDVNKVVDAEKGKETGSDKEPDHQNKEEEDEKGKDATNNQSNESNEEKTNEESTPQPVDKEKPAVSVVEIKTITIPSGSPGAKIAKILQENGLLEDPAEFIKVAEDLKLSLKLKSGTFEIPTNSTIEEMVRIIAK